MNKYRNPVSKEEYKQAKDIIDKYEKNMNNYEYFSKLYDLENKKKEHVYIHNKLKIRDRRVNSEKIRMY